MVLQVDKALLEIGRCADGQQVVIVAGSPPGIPGSTNALRIHNMALSSVDLPAPLGPMMPTSSPSWQCRLASLRMLTPGR